MIQTNATFAKKFNLLFIRLLGLLFLIISCNSRAYGKEIDASIGEKINNTYETVVNDEIVGEDTIIEGQEDIKEQEVTKEDEEIKVDEEIKEDVYTGSLVLNKNKVSLKEGKTYQLKVTLTEENLTGNKVTYQSSDEEVITVTKKGVVTAVHWGEATIYVTLGEAKTKCKVTVTKDVQITISAAGDVTLSSDIKQPVSVNFFSVYNKQKDDSYFFKNVKLIFEKDDMTIVNFEGTLSNRGKRVDKRWAFRGQPSYINILKEGSVEAVSFANNHYKDYGSISFTDTIESFKNAGIVYSSNTQLGIYEVKGIKIGMISIEALGDEDKNVEILRKTMEKMKKENPDLLIVSFHWGIEKTSKLTKSQMKLGRIAIDEGSADLVLGHHPHVLQPIEKYKDAYIVYSLGNFCFGGNTNPSDKDTMIYQQTFSFHNDKLVQDDNVRIIPCSVSSVKERNNYQPTPSTGKEKARILNKMNDYSKKFGISFDKNGKINSKK